MYLCLYIIEKTTVVYTIVLSKGYRSITCGKSEILRYKTGDRVMVAVVNKSASNCKYYSLSVSNCCMLQIASRAVQF